MSTACATARLVRSTTSVGAWAAAGRPHGRSPGRSANRRLQQRLQRDAERAAAASVIVGGGRGSLAAAENSCCRSVAGAASAAIARRRRRRRLAPPQRKQHPRGGAALEVGRLAGQRLGEPLGELAPAAALEARHLAEQHAQPRLVLRPEEVEERAARRSA